MVLNISASQTRASSILTVRGASLAFVCSERLIEYSVCSKHIQGSFKELTRHKRQPYSEPGAEKLQANTICLTAYSIFCEVSDGELNVSIVLPPNNKPVTLSV